MVYLSTDTDLSLVAGEIMSSEIESTVQLQGLPLVISTEVISILDIVIKAYAVKTLYEKRVPNPL